MEKDNFGLIYGLINPYFNGLVKIGMTHNLDINNRMRVLNIGVPKPFACAFAYKVPVGELSRVENSLHKALFKCRIEDSEFFEIEPTVVDNLLRTIGKYEPMTAAVQEVINTEEEKRKKLPNMDFCKMGLAIGDTLFWRDDRSITCTIASNKKVDFRDRHGVSLSSITQQILGKPYMVQPSPYWETEDRTPLLHLYQSYVQHANEELLRTQDNIANAAKECHTL